MTVTIGRRELLAALGGAAAWPLAGRAQQRAMPVVGVLRVNPRDSELFAGPFRRDMQAAGWVEGHNVRYDFVWADMSIERMPALASELVARNIDLVVTFGDPRHSSGAEGHAADSDRRRGRRHPLPRLSHGRKRRPLQPFAPAPLRGKALD
jgi:hypothetical protein